MQTKIVFFIIVVSLFSLIYGEEAVLNKEICKTTPTPTSGAFKRKCGQKETEIVLPKGKIPPIEELVFGVTYIECEEKTVDGHCSQFNCCQVSLNKDGKTVTKSACQFKGEKICTSPKPQPPVQVKRTTTMLPPKKPTICKKNQTSISGFCKPTKKKICKKQTSISSTCNEHPPHPKVCVQSCKAGCYCNGKGKCVCKHVTNCDSCPLIYRPVCGDGINYVNRCVAKCAHVKTITLGVCSVIDCKKHKHHNHFHHFFLHLKKHVKPVKNGLF